MGRVLKSLAEPAMLMWCRKSARQSITAAAKAANVTEMKIEEWESGTKSPTFNQLSLLANLYKRPTCVFYLQSPPTDFSLMRDFRTMDSEQREGEFSPQLAIAIRQARERSMWLSEYLQATDEPTLDFVGTSSRKSTPTSLGKKLRRILNVTIGEQSQCSSPDQALSMWKRKCEDVGVCVFGVGKIDPQEMSGFAIVDNYAPVIAINSRDSAAAKMFTLLHEMAHVLIGEEGVSDLSFGPGNNRRVKPIETFCNAVAAEALVPEALLVKSFDEYNGDNLVATAKLSAKFKVSQEVIARRLLDLKKVSRSFYSRIRSLCIQGAMLAAQRKEENPRKNVNIPQQTLVKSRVGVRFSKTAVSAFRNGEIDGSSLSDLLGMKLTHLGKLESSQFPFRLNHRGNSES